MGHLKSLGRNRSKIEGSICEGHLHAEAMFLCRSIVRQFGSVCIDLRVGDKNKEEERDGEVLLGGSTKKTLNAVELSQVSNN